MSDSSNYFHKWSKQQTRTLVMTPSYVQAIVSCTDCQTNNTFLTVVCRNGEILEQSAQNFSTTERFSRVKPPAGQEVPNERFQIEYAAFDAISDSFLFVLHSPDDKEIYWVSRQLLQQQNDVQGAGKGGVPMHTLISTEQNNNRSFCGIVVDAQRRILYTCNYECGKIDLWHLVADESSHLAVSYLGAVNCRDVDNAKMEPWYCALFCQHGTGKLHLAISDWENCNVVLYENQDKQSTPFTGHPNGVSPDEADMGFRYVGIIANASDEDKELGTVTFPHEMCFDNFGNLLVADAVNDRLQMFQLVENNNFQAMWVSESSCYHDRAIVVHDPISNRPIVLANHFDSVVCYE